MTIALEIAFAAAFAIVAASLVALVFWRVPERLFDEPDEIDVTETVRDPEAGPGEDPGEGPGISHDR